MAAPDRIIELVDRFRFNEKNYKGQNYNETQVRLEFINPFFEALGWDVSNTQGYAEAYKDVINEDKVKVAGATKAPDYSFRVGGTRKFFLEAKKPMVNLKEDIHPAYQLRRYAWSAKLPLSVLTDFEEFAVYDCRIKPGRNDKASTARTMYYTYKDYPDVWDEIAGIFSREAILKGSFDKYADSAKKKKGTAEVDDAFLNEMEQWRELLARNFALRNKDLSTRALNEVVQKTIDRIVFLRICEDRGIETYGQMQKLINVNDVYSHLRQIFLRADDRYNSGLFHFKSEKGRDDYDNYSLDLNIDDKPLKDIIKRLYYPESPYEFSVLPADILGHVYERFLGKVIRLTSGHQAKIEEKPEVRKAGGVYYTPTYIVEYIVKNTVGKLLDGKSTKQADKLCILDPACGSGSFLIGAYRYLLDWYLQKYTKKPGSHSKGKDPKIYQSSGGEWKLTTNEKKRILLNNIYGVDIDSQAVEVTKLSLLLKVLEGETDETLKNQMKLFEERALPDLGNNIKCGNSLIGSDFYDGREISMFDEDEMYRINVFDWEKEFPEIMKNGGFDAVIGNPPYVRQESFKEQKEYFKVKYETYHGTADLYVYFIERSIGLLKDYGQFSFIVANKWFRTNYGNALRTWLKNQAIEEIVDFGDLQVFKGATTYPCILRCSKNQVKEKFSVTNVKTLDFDSLEKYINSHLFELFTNNLEDKGWKLIDFKSLNVIKKIHAKGIKLEQYTKKKVFYGIKTGLNKAFVIDNKTKEDLINQDQKNSELIKPFLAGKDIKKYANLTSEQFLIFTRRGININHYPIIQEYLEHYRSELEPKPKDWDAKQSKLPPEQRKKWPGRKPGAYKWYELQDAIDYFQEFEKPKIIYPNILKKPEFTFDEKDYYTNQKCFIIAQDDKYLLGILNSKLNYFLFENILPKLRGGFYEPSYVFFKDFPIRTIDFNNPDDVATHDKMVSLVEQMLELNKKLNALGISAQEKKVLQKQIEITDRQIDKLVYELYDLTEEEIGIVEGVE